MGFVRTLVRYAGIALNLVPARAAAPRVRSSAGWEGPLRPVPFSEEKRS